MAPKAPQDLSNQSRDRCPPQHHPYRPQRQELVPKHIHSFAAGYHKLTWAAKMKRLVSLRPFVLDNSIRETTVVQLRGHTVKTKSGILEALQETGIKHVILAAFSELQRPEDVWLQNLGQRGLIPPDSYVFSEMVHDVVEGMPTSDIPTGLSRMKEYGVPGCILEMDLMCPRTDPQKFTEDLYKPFLMLRLDYIRSFSPGGNIFINYRDGLVAWKSPVGRRRMLLFTHLLCTLQPRIAGILFEDGTGEYWPEDIGEMCFGLRRTMDDFGWEDGHILAHFHKGYGLAEAAVLAALGAGATGLWGAVCEEGAGVGHASSLMMLTNLARLGNPHCATMYNLPKLYQAAVKVTQLVTHAEPYSKQELYGERACDQLWDRGAMMGSGEAFDLAGLLGRNRPVRMTSFCTAPMMQAHLTALFGPHDWNPLILRAMVVEMHEDLVEGRSLVYQTDAGAFDLYQRAGGVEFLEEMEAKVLRSQYDGPVVRALRERCAGVLDPDGEAMTYADFSRTFLDRYADRYPPEQMSQVLTFLDINADGDIQLSELLVWVHWQLQQSGSVETQSWGRDGALPPPESVLDHVLDAVFMGHIFPQVRPPLCHLSQFCLFGQDFAGLWGGGRIPTDKTNENLVDRCSCQKCYLMESGASFR